MVPDDPPDLAAPPRPVFRPGLFAIALLLVASVFPLIWMGGLVTSHGVGLSVPDWPNSYGYNMFLFPPSRWLGGIFYEHTHRLLGTLSGLLAVALALAAWAPARTPAAQRQWGVVAALLWGVTAADAVLSVVAVRGQWFGPGVLKLLPHFPVGFGSLAFIATLAWRCRRVETRRWVRWLTVISLVAVTVQGTLGGLRVDLVSRELAIVHGCFAQAFFALAAVQALVLSRWWVSAADRSLANDSAAGRTAFALAAVTVAVIYGQLIAGALMRHNGAGLAIPDLPLAYGHLLPPTDRSGLDAANAQRAWTYELPPVTLMQVWLHFAHRCGALVVSAAVLFTAGFVFQKLGVRRAAGRVAAILVGLLLTQVTLGLATVYLRKPADVASMHVATGALTLVTAVLLAMVLGRQYARRRAVRQAIVVPNTAALVTA